MEVKIYSCVKENLRPLVAVTLFAPAREASITALRLGYLILHLDEGEKGSAGGKSPFHTSFVA